jgi:asparagine synthase (glutamine-hydrolysing)
MCGIAGVLRSDGRTADLAVIEDMTAELASRGPDGVGVWASGPVALGHRRLSVIDISERGAQPMHDPELGCVLVFNGCIYNHEALRAELERDGYSFRSASDTVVILKAHHRWGDDAVEHLVGMFAYALHWVETGRTVLVRDRLGIKPLYLTESGTERRFASTLPALLAGGGVRTDLDPVALHHYVSFHSIVPGERTVLADVRKVPPGTIVSIDAHGRRTDRRYWRVEQGDDPDRADWSERDWQDAIADALHTAVRRRLVADVPVGVLLSGGLDSSLIVALLADHVGRVPTFSIGFDAAGGRGGDEFRWSDLVAREVGTDHHRLHRDELDLVAALPGAVRAMSEPMASHDVVAFHLLAREVSDHVKVVQSGQGADEVFAGYHWFQEIARAEPGDAGRVYLDRFRDRSHAEVGSLLNPALVPGRDVSGELVTSWFEQRPTGSAIDRALGFEVSVMLPADPVMRVDNMTMGAGLEARVPFLDADLVELAGRCPAELKVDGDGKGILKEIGRKLLPAEVVDRPKGYFPVPALVHLEGDVLRCVRDVLSQPAARARGVFADGVIDCLLAEPNRAITPTGGNLLWHATVLEWWLQEHVDR